MSEKKKLFIRVLIIVLVLGLVTALVATINYFQQEINQLNSRLENLENKNTDLANDNSELVLLNQSLTEENNIMKETINTLEETMAKPDEGFNEIIALGLKEKGYPGTVEDIIEDLLDNQEIIPYDGSLGGTMGFYDASNIEILTDRWALAYFEDGHGFGFMLLEYEYSENDLIWRVIDAYMFGE